MNQREDADGQRGRDGDAKTGRQGPDPGWARRARRRLRAQAEGGGGTPPQVGFDFELVLGPQARHRLRRLLRGPTPVTRVIS